MCFFIAQGGARSSGLGGFVGRQYYQLRLAEEGLPGKTKGELQVGSGLGKCVELTDLVTESLWRLREEELNSALRDWVEISVIP